MTLSNLLLSILSAFTPKERPDSDLQKRIKKHEGCRLVPYKDTLGNLTVGWGRNLNVPFTQAEVDFMFLTDFDRATRAAESFPEYKNLSAARKGVIIELCYQLGKDGASKFVKFWRAVKEEDWESAYKELIDSKLHEQTPERCEELANIFRGK